MFHVGFQTIFSVPPMHPMIRSCKTIDLESLDDDDDCDDRPRYLFQDDDEFSLACARHGIDLSDLQPGVNGNEFHNLILTDPGDMHTEIDLDPTPYVSDEETMDIESFLSEESGTLFSLIEAWYAKVSDDIQPLPWSLNHDESEQCTAQLGPSDVREGNSSELQSRGNFGDGDCAAGPHNGDFSQGPDIPQEDGESEEGSDDDIDESDYQSDTSTLSSRYDGVWKHDDRSLPIHRSCPICRPVGYCKYCSSSIRRPRRF